MDTRKVRRRKWKVLLSLTSLALLLLLVGWQGLERIQWGDMLLFGMILLFGGNLAIGLGMLVEGVQRVTRPKPRKRVMRWSGGRWKYPVYG